MFTMVYVTDEALARAIVDAIDTAWDNSVNPSNRADAFYDIDFLTAESSVELLAEVA